MEIAFREHEVWATAPAEHQTQAVEARSRHSISLASAARSACAREVAEGVHKLDILFDGCISCLAVHRSTADPRRFAKFSLPFIHTADDCRVGFLHHTSKTGSSIADKSGEYECRD